MTHKRGQVDQSAVGVDALAIPSQQRSDGERVTFMPLAA